MCIPSEEYFAKGKKRTWCMKVTGMGMTKENGDGAEGFGMTSGVERETIWVLSFEAVEGLKEWMGRLKETARSLRVEPPSPSHLRAMTPPRLAPEPLPHSSLAPPSLHQRSSAPILSTSSTPSLSKSTLPSQPRRFSTSAAPPSPSPTSPTKHVEPIVEPSSPTSRRSSFFLSSGSPRSSRSSFPAPPPPVGASPPTSPSRISKGKSLVKRLSARATSPSPPFERLGQRVLSRMSSESIQGLDYVGLGGLGEAIELKSNDANSKSGSGSGSWRTGGGGDRPTALLQSLPTPPRVKQRISATTVFDNEGMQDYARPRLLSGGGEAALADIQQVLGYGKAGGDENRREDKAKVELMKDELEDEDDDDEFVSLHPYRQASSPRSKQRSSEGSPRRVSDVPPTMMTTRTQPLFGSPPSFSKGPTPPPTSPARRVALSPFHDRKFRDPATSDVDASSLSSYASSNQHHLFLPPRAPPPTTPLPEPPFFERGGAFLPGILIRPISATSSTTNSSTSKRMSNISTGSYQSSNSSTGAGAGKTRLSSPPLLAAPSGALPPPPPGSNSSQAVPVRGLTRTASAASTYSSHSSAVALTQRHRNSSTPPPSSFVLPLALPRPPPTMPLPPTPKRTGSSLTAGRNYRPNLMTGAMVFEQATSTGMGTGTRMKLELEEMGKSASAS